ncbi:hypothetical protein ACFFHM_02065 [Halalkalibacter kiskunsagensis]|uniref:Uncharacterized protein n=1 Tax=Halalkalibacter kiskunsagensis TaxID=1548599 RepID=A0ABV6K7S2_9BACI
MTNSSLFQEESELYRVLEQDVAHTYKLITSSRYVNNRNLEQVSNDAKKRVANLTSDNPWQDLLTYMRGIYLLSRRTNQYEEFDRRFSYFYQSLSHDILEYITELDSDQERQFLSKLLDLMIDEPKATHAPWPSLLFKLLLQMPREQIDYVYQQFLSKSITATDSSRNFALTCSYIALLAGKEVTSLAILQKHGDFFHEQDVASHFQLLKTRGRWRTMKQWFSVLFPKKKTGHYGSLQKYADEMNTALPMSSKEQESIWQRWLMSPSFNRFQTYVQHLSSEQKHDLIEDLLPKLEQRLHQLDVAKTYEKILLTFEKHEQAVRYLLKNERDPLKLREEKVELLQAIKKVNPILARPIYHQYIVRLVEKKSRIHYEQAAAYLKELQSLYESKEDQMIFMDYVRRLKKLYRTYRAFIEELKHIGL